MLSSFDVLISGQEMFGSWLGKSMSIGFETVDLALIFPIRTMGQTLDHSLQVIGWL